MDKKEFEELVIASLVKMQAEEMYVKHMVNFAEELFKHCHARGDIVTPKMAADIACIFWKRAQIESMEPLADLAERLSKEHDDSIPTR
jgi:hypothetical protein